MSAADLFREALRILASKAQELSGALDGERHPAVRACVFSCPLSAAEHNLLTLAPCFIACMLRFCSRRFVRQWGRDARSGCGQAHHRSHDPGARRPVVGLGHAPALESIGRRRLSTECAR